MTSFKFFIEIFLSIHVLLFVSSLFIRSHFLLHKPSFKLNLARLVIVSCVLSPVAVHFVKKTEKPFIANFVSMDTLQSYKNKPVLNKNTFDASSTQYVQASKISFMNYWPCLFILLLLGSLYQTSRLFKDLRKLKSVLRSAQIYRSFGRLTICVTDRCFIPFSVRWFNTAYIVLPVSLLNSSTNVKMAIAHEGQHHRQGDCLWSYFTEGIRIAFWGNPSVHRWHRILVELQELSCDEALVGHQMISVHDYGHCLFKVAQTASRYSESTHRKIACTVGMAWHSGDHEKSFITRRICMLSQYKLHAQRRSFVGVVLAISAIVGPLCTAYAAMGTLSQSTAKEIDTSSLNPKIQQIANAEIRAAVKKYHAKSAVIAVADPRTGKIIAFAEAGSVSGADSWKSRLFPAASTIKPFVAAAAIEAGVISESPVMSDAMAKSDNIFMINVAKDLGSEKFRKSLAEFGFDTNSQWDTNSSDTLQLANASIGKTIPVTIETVTKAYAILANKGHLFPENSGSIISESTANSVTNMLVETVDHGTGKRAALTGKQVAGKTGTLDDPQRPSSSLALFGGYVPANAPRFVAFVVIEDGHGIGEAETEMASGGAVAAPVFHDVAKNSLVVLSK